MTSTRNFEFPAKLESGKEGNLIKLLSNYFLLDYKYINIFHYDIDILVKKDKFEPVSADEKQIRKSVLKEDSTQIWESVFKEDSMQREKVLGRVTSHMIYDMKRVGTKNIYREVVAEMLKTESLRKCSPVYDGQKNIYTTKPMPFTKRKFFEITLKDSNRDFKVVVQPVRKMGGGNVISTVPLRQIYAGRRMDVPWEIITAFNTVMNDQNTTSSRIKVGHEYFMSNQRTYDLGKGMTMCIGCNQSLHFIQRGPAVLVNFKAKTFHKLLTNDIIYKFFNTNDHDLQKIRKVESHGKHLKKKLKLSDCNQPQSLQSHSSNWELTQNDEDISYGSHLRETYQPQSLLSFSRLHLRERDKMFQEGCTVVLSQAGQKMLSSTMVSKVIKQTLVPPDHRFSEIVAHVEMMKQSNENAMCKFGLFLNNQCMELQGRVIAPPELAYKRKESVCHHVVRPDNCGKWAMDGNEFYCSPKSCSWVLISFSNESVCSMVKLKHFADTLCSSAHDAGIKLENVKKIKICDPTMSTTEALKYAKDRDVTFTIVVLRSKGSAHSYEEVKFIADSKLRLVTQCMDELVVAKKFNAQVATNVLLKINSKIGGVNHTLLTMPLIFTRPIIVLAAHGPSAMRRFSSSFVTAVVGSLDAFPFRYAVACRTQNRGGKKGPTLGDENMKEMVKEILEKFKNNCKGKYPEKIIFFRSGVGHGQYRTVLENEVLMIQCACNEVLAGNLPPLTLIVVHKSHQLRFRPQSPKKGVGKMGNVPLGTTVDSDVTHPLFSDFFICSHGVDQGTSKPTHYTVLSDENDFSPDELQKLCYHLCHMYVRCNHSISVPAPVMYARLAFSRAKKYASLLQQDDEWCDSVKEARLRIEVEEAIKNMSDFDPGMFFV